MNDTAGNPMPDEIQVDRMTPQHWQRVKTIRIRALQDAPNAFGMTLKEALLVSDKDWRLRLASKINATFLASIEGRDVGMVVGAPYDDDCGLFAMWVAPEVRGCGIGEELVKAVVTWASQSGHRRILLDVADTNTAAVAFYKRNGFAATGAVGALDPPRQHIKEHQRCRQIDGIERRSG